MEIIDIKPRGYCKGVARAIIKARQARTEYSDQKVTILGSIVHNRHVVDMLEDEGITTVLEDGRSRLDLLDEIKEGVVIFSAHGVSDRVREKATSKGLMIVDATCEDVTATAEMIDDWIKEGGDVIYFGKPGHPEAVGICEGRERTYLVSQPEEMDLLVGRLGSKVLVTNQTTLSLHDTAQLYQEAVARFPQATLANEICSATRVRQEAVMNHPDLDVLVVVGDPASNNTAMLAKMGEMSGVGQVVRIEGLTELTKISFKENDRVGITSGASTPTEITESVSDYLKRWSREGERPQLEDITFRED